MLHSATSCYTAQHHATQRNIMLHSTTSCYTAQHHATQRNIMLHSATSCYTVQHHATQRNIMLHSATSCYTAQHHATQRSIMLYVQQTLTTKKSILLSRAEWNSERFPVNIVYAAFFSRRASRKSRNVRKRQSIRPIAFVRLFPLSQSTRHTKVKFVPTKG